jgi:histone chaperone ASF1
MILKIKPPIYLDIPFEEIIGLTVILLKFWYKKKEFIRLGYFINNELNEEGIMQLTKDEKNLSLNHITRKILIDQPRITYYPVISNSSLEI